MNVLSLPSDMLVNHFESFVATYTRGFFKCHRDFNSTTSNLIEEFSLIVCVTPEDEAKHVVGGETAVLTFGGVDGAKPVEKLFDTKTPGCALLFRKDLNHEGKKLIKGVKHIITANIFAVKRTQSEQVLYVTFPENNKELKNDSDRNVDCQKANWQKHKADRKKASTEKNKADAKAAIMCVANDSKSYVLPVSCLTGTMLESHVNFNNTQVEAEGKEPPLIVPFVCRDFSFEQFGVVARVLNRCYVDEASISHDKACLDFFGPFKVENLLVDLALEPNTKQPPEKKLKQNAMWSADESSDPDVIVCENEARMKAVLNTARAFNEPYVPFKILFIEGMLHDFDGDGGGGIVPIEVPMTAAAGKSFVARCFLRSFH